MIITWITTVQLLLVISLTGAQEDKDSFDNYFKNFFQRSQEKIPRAIPNGGPQNVHSPKALPQQQVPVKKPPGRVVTPNLQTHTYQVAGPVPRLTFYNIPQPVQYQKLQPPVHKYTAAYIPQQQPQVAAVRSPSPDTSLKFRPEDAVNPSYQISSKQYNFSPNQQVPKDQPSGQYNFSPNQQGPKEQSSKQYNFSPSQQGPKEQSSKQYSFSPSQQIPNEKPSGQYGFNPSKEQPSGQYSYSGNKEQPSRQYSFTARQLPKEEQRQFDKYSNKEYSSKKPSYRDDEYYYKGSDQGYHEHVKVKSSHTHKKQTTGGTEDYYDGDYGDYDSKRGYRSLEGI